MVSGSGHWACLVVHPHGRDCYGSCNGSMIMGIAFDAGMLKCLLDEWSDKGYMEPTILFTVFSLTLSGNRPSPERGARRGYRVTLRECANANSLGHIVVTVCTTRRCRSSSSTSIPIRNQFTFRRCRAGAAAETAAVSFRCYCNDAVQHACQGHACVPGVRLSACVLSSARTMHSHADAGRVLRTSAPGSPQPAGPGSHMCRAAA